VHGPPFWCEGGAATAQWPLAVVKVFAVAAADVVVDAIDADGVVIADTTAAAAVATAAFVVASPSPALTPTATATY